MVIVNSISCNVKAQPANENESLNARQQSIVTIAAFTANGDQTNLTKALHEGLDATLTINEIKEVLVQLYAYTGFPRSLNALNSFMEVLKERKQKGINDEIGKAPTPLPTNKTKLEFGTEKQTQLVGRPVKGEVYEFAPVIDQFLKEHLFGDIFGRDNLDFKTREIVTIAALASLGGAENQLRSHMNVGMYNGLTQAQLSAIVSIIQTKVGHKQGNDANAVLRSLPGSGTSTTSTTSEKTGVSFQRVTFPNQNITVVGNLFTPANFDKSKKYPVIIVGHPAGGVKEQAAGTYARKLAAEGFITLAFDASYQGESGGEPRYLEDPAVRVEDFRAAADFVSSYPSVDANKIGVMGICAGGGFAIKSAQTEHRFKAVATVSMVDLGQLRREGLGGVLKEQMQQRLDAVAKQRTLESQGEPIKYVNYVANSLDEIPENAPVMYREGYEYYRTARGQHPNSPNKYVFTSLDKLMGFTALDHVEMIAPRPLLIIAGSEADSFYFSQEAFDKAKGPKEFFKVPGASHIAMYDNPQYIDQAVTKMTDFFKTNLK